VGDHPSGTVTFLFSDIEGSTRLWEVHGTEMAAALRRHDGAIRSAVGAAGGYVFSTAGDAFAVAFERAGDAVVAAIEAQRALALTASSAPQITVRMGIHTGEADERDDDYFGPAVNRAARLMALAHGGQVLLSDVTARLVADQLPPDVSVVDLGEHGLRDLDRPERVHQLVDVTCEQAFPPLSTPEVVPNNLPRHLTSFIGRRGETAELRSLVGGHRLVTVTGVGGVGKTRLGLRVAGDELPRFGDGVWFVELASLHQPEQVPKQVATALGIQEQANRPVTQTVIDHLRPRRALVILDNCEHVVQGAAAFVDALLGATADVHVLATSRQVLGVPGEQVWVLEPMQLPEPDADRLDDNEAATLFVDRARLADPRFTLDAPHRGACARLCRALDGVPLAIELAAARVGVLTVEQIADGVTESLTLLTKGARTASARQHTMRAAIDWSYELLDPGQQSLLRRLAVFRGGFTVDAARAVSASVPSATLDDVDRLVDQSLVEVVRGARNRRFRLLEPVRARARELLDEADESHAALEHHRAFFLDWAHRQSRLLITSDQLAALGALEEDHDNLIATLDRSFIAGELRDALRLAADLSFFWFVHSHFSESGAWYDKLLAERGHVDPHSRIKLLLGAGEFFENTGDDARATACFEEARALADESGSPRLEGYALFNLFNAAGFGMRFAEARDLGHQALERFRQVDDLYGIGMTTFALATLDLGESLTAGPVRRAEAEDLLAQLAPMVEVVRGTGERNVLGHALEAVGTASSLAEDPRRAAECLAEAVDAFEELGSQTCLAHCLERVAWLADRHELSTEAVRLLSAAEALRERIGIAAPPAYDTLRQQVRRSAELGLGVHGADGGDLDRQGAIEIAHEITETVAS
jgi:predicted ATPase/class 3 adenylate cyclase